MKYGSEERAVEGALDGNLMKTKMRMKLNEAVKSQSVKAIEAE